MEEQFVVSISFRGRGRWQGGEYCIVESFSDEAKARDYYTDMLVKYPNVEVKFEKV